MENDVIDTFLPFLARHNRWVFDKVIEIPKARPRTSLEQRTYVQRELFSASSCIVYRSIPSFSISTGRSEKQHQNTPEYILTLIRR
jgi:hypothetical protein